jgi:lambda family phage portal protein
MIDKLFGFLKSNKAPERKKQVVAKFDSASRSGENTKHWLNADSLSADAAANPETRKVLRERSRYETSNNCYAYGVLETIADYTVGSGAKLQLLTEDKELNAQIEQDFNDWAETIHLADKLRIARIAKCRDGEVFIRIGTNLNLRNSDVKLDVNLIETDCVTDSNIFESENFVDGIVYDKYGNPTEYHILRKHPGGNELNLNPLDYEKVPAEYIIHYLYANRPGQHRGIPEITPALPLFAQSRRYTLATLSAAEAAADFAAVIYTDNPVNGESADLEPLDSIQLDKNMAVTLPEGWKLGQMDAKQPTSTYREFSNQMLHEMARCFKMPFCLVYGDFGGANYASGRMDFQTFYKTIQVEQKAIINNILNPIFREWLKEYRIVKNLKIDTKVLHSWFWDGMEHVDPNKEASASDTRLKNCTTTYAYEFAKQGKDWEKEFVQISLEKKRMEELGIISSDINQKLNQETDGGEE